MGELRGSSVQRQGWHSRLRDPEGCKLVLRVARKAAPSPCLEQSRGRIGSCNWEALVKAECPHLFLQMPLALLHAQKSELCGFLSFWLPDRSPSGTSIGRQREGGQGNRSVYCLSPC